MEKCLQTKTTVRIQTSIQLLLSLALLNSFVKSQIFSVHAGLAATRSRQSSVFAIRLSDLPVSTRVPLSERLTEFTR